MRRVLIHFGPPKTGSTSIQTWLADNAGQLRKEHGIDFLAASGRTRFTSRQRLTAHSFRRRGENSGWIGQRYREVTRDAFDAGDDWDDARRRYLAPLGESIRRLADKRDVVLSGEGLWYFLERRQEMFLELFDSIGQSYDVRFVVYLRPQHRWMEAAWRQWGFRRGVSPSTYLEGEVDALDYWPILEDVRGLTSNITVVARPFVEELLTGRDVVTDFATTVLEVDPTRLRVPTRHVNVGLSLPAANALSLAPPGRYYTDADDNETIDRLRKLDVDWPEDPAAIERSRHVLQSWCHARFEPGNRELLRDQGWPLEHFVPPVDGDPPDSLDLLDRLWAPPDAEALDRFWPRLDDALRQQAPVAARTP